MVVDDLVVCGAEPLFMTDYIAAGQIVPERIAAMVGGIAAGCEQAGCALLGGETAEHPGLMTPDEYDIAATGRGRCRGRRLLGPDRVRPGDAVIAMASRGCTPTATHWRATCCWRLSSENLRGHAEEFGRTLGEEMLEPTRIYTKDCLALAEADLVHAFSHVTGGGLASNLARVLPSNLHADIRRSTWEAPPVFEVLMDRGVDRADAERTFNMGIGMVAIVPDAQPVLSLLAQRGIPAWVCGDVRDRRGGDTGDAPAKGGAGGSVRLIG